MTTTFLKAKKILDGRGGAKDHAGIVVSGGRIREILPSAPDGAETIDYGDATILPGLINAHAHIDTPPVLKTVEWITGVGKAEHVIETVRNLEQTLASGVTYVRNMGSRDMVDLEVKAAVEKGLVQGPGIVTCGRMLCMTGGHGNFIGLESDGVDECRKHTRQLLKAGVGHVKFMASGGILTPGSVAGREEFTFEEVAAIVDEAHKAGRKTAVHASGTPNVLKALKAGTDSVEHGYDIDDACRELMVKQGTYLVPTLAPAWFFVQYGREAGIPAYIFEDRGESSLELQRESFRKAVEAGVRIATGSDAGTPFNGHGSLAVEIRLMVEAGMRPSDAIVASTWGGADLLGIGKDLGSIEAGKAADLLVVDGDPLENISVLEKPLGVWKDGKKIF
ncbi:MAG: amidohydrolase family protein [Clostridiales Family XIII bacterium]|jgi:imidazolonepropionase-like amidohydrolase|nr:amidohydrolase family protein [Clostridiales Family XIII bacterium]